MAERLRQDWNISSPVNVAFLAILLILATAAIGLSLVQLFGLPLVFTERGISTVEELPSNPQFSMQMTDGSFHAGMMPLHNSPYEMNITLLTPPLKSGDAIETIVTSNGRVLEREGCPEDEEPPEGATNITCIVKLDYDYLQNADMKIYATLEDVETGEKYAASSPMLTVGWASYESEFWASSAFVLAATIAGLAIVGAVAAAMFFFTTRVRHAVEYEGEYSLDSLLHPFRKAKTASQAFQAFISSPLFWMFEIVGILVVLVYLAVVTEPWKSSSAAFAFFISGVIAFITPFLWAALMWFAEYREREPLRIIVSMFLWGGLSCLMAIGINSITSDFFAICGLSFLAASFTAPIFEELFKGTGLALFSFHHEYNDMADGIVYGFIIGMGFSFVENWLYLLKNPMGADVGSWLLVFTLRSIVFSANHGVFTALMGGAIGLLKQRKFPYASLGLLAGILPAMALHAIHNSGEIWDALLGTPGMCAYCCILLPIFDYGGLAVVALLLIAGVAFMQHKRE